MFKVVSLDKRDFNIIMLIIFVLFMVLSLEMLFIVKDISFFDKWYQLMIDTNGIAAATSKSDAFNLFISTNINIYVTRAIIPFFFILHTYFAYTKIGINKLYIYFWTAMFLTQLFVTGLSMDLTSIIYYIKLSIYIIMSIRLISLRKTID